ncbi:ATP-binding protein [Nonomuraea sp. NPDC050227]|uniref:ATP-binding protein n=1 Tax=Nonomuraea sp. NPDC050227 TaxID=3364360 RepID=UPI003788D187
MPGDAETPPALATVVTGGHVGKIVNIAYAANVAVHSDSLESVPRVQQLPPDISDFTGRDDALETLETLLVEARPAGAAVVISAISGKAGVGKTALAVHAGHRLSTRYPDGQMYVNLRGYESQRLRPEDVLAEFLRMLGADDADIPADPDVRERLYRARIAERSMLVVLDNAVSEQQVRPLLPGSARCGVIITSRSRLAGLDGSRSLDLDVLSAETALALLTKIVGTARVEAEPEAAARICTLCGGLPLAIRIAGAKLAARPHWRLTRMAGRLEDERRRLDELRLGDREVRTGFELSYAMCDPGERRMLHALGLLEALDFAAWSAAALAGVSQEEAEDLLDRLVQSQLIESMGEDTRYELRYRFHDLLRLFAREKLAAEETADGRRGALLSFLEVCSDSTRRALAVLPAGVNYLKVAEAAMSPLKPLAEDAGPTTAEAFSWFAAEQAVLMSAVRQAFAAELWGVAWELAYSLTHHLRLRSQWRDAETLYGLALQASRRSGNGGGEAAILRSLGNCYRDQRRFEEALTSLGECVRLYRDLGQSLGVAQTLSNMGDVFLELNRFDDARGCLEESLTAIRELGTAPLIEAYTINSLGCVHKDQGDFARALELFDECLAMFREYDDSVGEAWCLRCMGDTQMEAGRLREAMTTLQQALSLFEVLGDQVGEGWNQRSLGELLRGLGRYAEGERAVLRCLELFRAAGDRFGEAWGLRGLGDHYRAVGDWPRAMASFEESLELFAKLHPGVSRGEAAVLIDLGRTQQATGQLEEARHTLERSARLYSEMRDRAGEAWALCWLGAVLGESGLLAQSGGALDEAYALFEQMDMPRGEAVIAFHRAEGCAAASDRAAATVWYETALATFSATGDEWWAITTRERMARHAP